MAMENNQTAATVDEFFGAGQKTELSELLSTTKKIPPSAPRETVEQSYEKVATKQKPGFFSEGGKAEDQIKWAREAMTYIPVVGAIPEATIILEDLIRGMQHDIPGGKPGEELTPSKAMGGAIAMTGEALGLKSMRLLGKLGDAAVKDGGKTLFKKMLTSPKLKTLLGNIKGGDIGRQAVMDLLVGSSEGIKESDPSKAIVEGGVAALAGPLFSVLAKGAGKLIPSSAKNIAREQVQKLFFPAVKGRLQGKTINAMNSQMEKVTDGAITIAAAKDAIEITDPITGITQIGTPINSIYTAGQAAGQTKQVLWDEIEGELATVGKDMKISGADVATEIAEDQQLATTISALKKLGGSDARMAREAEAAIDEMYVNDFTLPEYRAALKVFKETVSAKKGKGEVLTVAEQLTARKLAVMEKRLDIMLEDAIGTNKYRELMRQYGGVREMEGMLVKRFNSLLSGNQNQILGMTDVFSSGEFVAGIIMQNPAMLARSITQVGAKGMMKKMANPDAMIKKLFEKLYKAAAKNAPKEANTATNYLFKDLGIGK